MAGQTFTLNIKALFDASDVKAKVGEIQNAFKNIKLPDNLQKSFTSSFDSLNKALTDFETRAAKGVKTKADAKGLTGSMDKVITEFTKVQSVVDKIRSELGTSIDLSKAIKLDDATLNKLNDLKQQIADIQKQLSSVNTNKIAALEASLKQIKSGSGASKQGQAALDLFKAGDVQGAIDALDKIIAKLQVYAKTAENAHKDTTNVENSIKQLDAMRTTMQGAQNESASLIAKQNAKAAESAQVLSNAQAKVVNQVDQAANSISNYGNRARGASSDISNMANNQARLNTELEQVKSRIQYFFGIANSINLVKRAIRGAVDTVKELDKAMTETAVVTNYTISDMWKQLPEYTKRANELGVTTKDAYESATLYFQQGLNNDQAAALSVETLKMARIAGLEAAEATDRMTNALRGFNMELNTTSAQRVDDVYSQLAAMSASNVDEISTAMTKVASLAHSANMEFETTAAFLAQIIETTRESAETAGTALKTVAARFSEVKKLVDTDQLKGTDEEGEGIDVNKVSAALRTAGIDLNKYFIGEVGLDDIFMELASKWDSLTSIQQRYIATQAAGSRQQSRFIALMQDYARTQELVSAAYGAEGASARQFEKTQDSLQSKLARLKNAWNEFLMGITNSGVIKGAVGALTKLLNIINKLTGAFGPAASGFLKFGIAAATISAGKKAFLNGGLAEKVLGSLGNTPLGSFLGLGGNTTQITSAGAEFHGEVVSAGAEFAAAVRGAAGVEAATGGVGGVGRTGEAALRLTPWQALKKFKADNAGDATAYKAYQQMSAEAAALGEKNLYQQELNYYRPTNTLFGALGKKFGATKFGGKVASGLGAGLKTLGIGSGAAVSGAAALAATIGTITVVAGAAAIAIKKMYDASPAGQVKIAEKYASAMSSVADEARKAKSDIEKVQEDYNNYNEAVNKADTSSKRSTAIQERNDYITSLLEQNSAYAEYLHTTFKDGEILLTLDSDKLAAAVDKIAEGAVKAGAYSEMANAVLSGRQANLYRSKLTGIDLENGTREVDINALGSAGSIETSLNPEEYARYLGYQTAAERSDAQMRSYVEHAAAQLIDTNILADETASVVAHFISESFNAANIQSKVVSQKRADWWNNEATEDQLRAKYALIYGMQAAEGTSKSELAENVAFAEVMEQTTEAAIEKLQGLLTGENGSIYENILSAASGIGEINSVNLSDIKFEDDAEALFSALSIDPANFEALETAAGLTEGSLQKQIVAQAKLIKDIQKVNKAKIYENLLRAGISVTKEFQTMVQGMSPEQAQKVADITTNAQEALSPELYQGLLTHIPQLMQSEELNDIQNFFNSFDLSDPINAFLQLRAAEEKAQPRGMFEGLLKAIEQTNAALFDSGNLFQTFLTSSEYDDLTESLDDFIKKNGEISGENIEELAENCKGLKAVLDKDKISAQGLAKALTALQQGNAPIEGLTTRVLEALSNFNDFNTMLGEISDTIANFDPGRDFGEGSDFLVQQADNLLELIDSYEFGNEQTRNIYDLFFGKGAYDDFMSEWGYKGVEEYADLMKAQIKQLKDWADNNSYGFLRDFAGNQDLGITQIGDYDFKWDTQGRTTEQLIAKVQEQANISREAAEMIIEGFAAQSYDFAAELKQNDYSEFLKDFSTSASETRTITEQELVALGAAFGKTSDEIYADLKKLGKEKGIDIPIRVNWQDENGANLTEEALFEEFTKKIGDFEKYAQNYINNNGEIDASALLSGLLSTGLTESQASEIANKIVSSIDGAKLTKTISVPILAEDNETVISKDVVISADSVENLTAAENAAIEKANYELFGQKLADQNFDGLRTSLDTFIEEVKEKLTTTLQGGVDGVEVSALKENLKNGIVEAGNEGISDVQQNVSDTEFNGVIKFTADYSGIDTSGNGNGGKEDYSDEVERVLDEINNKHDDKGDTQGTVTVDVEANTAEAAADTQEALANALLAAAEASGTNVALELSTDVKNGDYSIVVSWTWADGQGPSVSTSGASGGIAKGTRAYGVSGGGGRPRMATKAAGGHQLQAGEALTGEEGPEIVWNKEQGYAYVTGEHGPEFRYLNPGDRVFNANETARIFAHSFAKGGIYRSLATGSWNPKKLKDKDDSKGGGGSGSGSGADSEKESEWKNEIDWIYNLVQDIEELERKQTKLQEDYEDYLQDQTKTGKDLYNLLIQQLGNLYTQLNHQQAALELREREMREFMDTTNEFDDLLWYNWNDRTLEIDWDAIEALQDKDTYDKVNDLVSQAEAIEKKMDDADDSIIDIKNKIQELENIWRDTYVDFESRVFDAVVSYYQEIIDNYSELHNTLTDSNSQILNSLQKEISLQRQIRDNTKTEEEITNDEAQLAYLRRDTSGGNDLAALQLERELAESRQSYEDTLVDQAISRLEEDNDAAAQQRQQQIDIMQAQLDYQSQNGEFNAYVSELLTNAMGAEGELLTNSDLVNLLKEQENWAAMSDVSKEVWEEELNTTFKEVAAFLLKQNAEENGTFYTALTAAVNTVSTAIGSYSQAITKMTSGSGGGSGGSSGGGSSGGSGGSKKEIELSHSTTTPYTIATDYAYVPTSVPKAVSGVLKYKKYIYKYATGGLADTTGPAWLDGTPSEPEYVLNARQTDAFLKLADVLPSIMGSGVGAQTNTFGGTYITMPVTLESVSPDYDVDRMVGLLKDKLYDAGSYRNVNSLSFIR